MTNFRFLNSYSDRFFQFQPRKNKKGIFGSKFKVLSLRNTVCILANSKVLISSIVKVFFKFQAKKIVNEAFLVSSLNSFLLERNILSDKCEVLIFNITIVFTYSSSQIESSFSYNTVYILTSSKGLFQT